jgi:hypothetical protein
MLSALRSKRPLLASTSGHESPDTSRRTVSLPLFLRLPPSAQPGPARSTISEVPLATLGLATATQATPSDVDGSSILCSSPRVPDSAVPLAAPRVSAATEVPPLEDAAVHPGLFVRSSATELFDQHKYSTASRSSAMRASDDLLFLQLVETRKLKVAFKDSSLLHVLSLHLSFLNISAWQLKDVLLDHVLRHADELANLPHAYQSRDVIIDLARILRRGAYTIDHPLYITAYSHLFNVRVQILMMQNGQLVEHHIVACAPRPVLTTVTVEFRLPSSYALLSSPANVPPGHFASVPLTLAFRKQGKRDSAEIRRSADIRAERIVILETQARNRYYPYTVVEKPISPPLGLWQRERTPEHSSTFDSALIGFYFRTPPCHVFPGASERNITGSLEQLAVHIQPEQGAEIGDILHVYVATFDPLSTQGQSDKLVMLERGIGDAAGIEYDAGFHAFNTASLLPPSAGFPRNIGARANSSPNPKDWLVYLDTRYHLSQPYACLRARVKIEPRDYRRETLADYTAGDKRYTGPIEFSPATAPSEGLVAFEQHFLHLDHRARTVQFLRTASEATTPQNLPVFANLEAFLRVASSAHVSWLDIQHNLARRNTYYVRTPTAFWQWRLQDMRITDISYTRELANSMLSSLYPSASAQTHCGTRVCLSVLLAGLRAEGRGFEPALLSHAMRYLPNDPSLSGEVLVNGLSVIVKEHRRSPSIRCHFVRNINQSLHSPLEYFLIVDIVNPHAGKQMIALNFHMSSGEIEILSELPSERTYQQHFSAEAVVNRDAPSCLFHATREGTRGGNKKKAKQNEKPAAQDTSSAPAAEAPSSPRTSTPAKQPASSPRGNDGKQSAGSPRRNGPSDVHEIATSFEFDPEELEPEPDCARPGPPAPRRWETSAPAQYAEHTFRYPVASLYSSIGHAQVFNGATFNDHKSGRGAIETADHILIGGAPTPRTPAGFRPVLAALRQVQYLFPPLDLADLDARLMSDKSIFIQSLSAPNCGFFWVRLLDGATIRTGLASPEVHQEYNPSMVYPKFFEIVFNASLGGSIKQGSDQCGPAHPWTFTFQPLSKQALDAVVHQPPLLVAAIPAHRSHFADALVTLQLLLNRFPYQSSVKDMAKNPHPVFIVLLIRQCSAKPGQRYTQVTLRAVCALSAKYTMAYVTGLRDNYLEHLHLEQPATVQLILVDSHVMAISSDSPTVESYVRDHFVVFPTIQIQHLKVYGTDCTYSANLRAALERICGLRFGRIHPEAHYQDIPVVQAIVSGSLALDRSNRPQFYKEQAFWLRLSVPPSPGVQSVLANMAGTDIAPEWSGLPFDQILDSLRTHDRPMLSNSQLLVSRVLRPSAHMLTEEELAKLQRGQLSLQDILHPNGAPLLLQVGAHADQAVNSRPDNDPETLTSEALDKALADSEATMARLRAAKRILDSKSNAGVSSSLQMSMPPSSSNVTPAAGAAASSTFSTK